MEKLKNKVVIFLRWSEKYTKTDMLYLAKGGFWAITGQIILSTIIFLLAIAFAHFVSKETYGQYKYVLSIASILGAFTLTGLNSAVLQSVSRGFDGALRHAFWKGLKWSMLFFLGALFVSIYYFYQGNIFIGISMLVVGCAWPFFNSSNLYSPFLVAKKDFKRSAIYFDIIGNLFPALCLFATMITTRDPLWLVIAYFVSNALIGIILYARICKIYRPNKNTDEDMVGYSKHLSFINIFNVIGTNIDQILVFHYIGAAQLAIYNFATAIPNQIKGPVKNLANLIFPKFAERSDKDIESGMGNKFFYLFITSVGLIIIYIAMAPYIFRIFFPKYIDSIFYSQIFSLSLLWMISEPANVYLSAKKKIKEIYTGNILNSILQIVFVFVGIFWWGLLGLIIARVVIRISFGMINILLYRRALKSL